MKKAVIILWLLNLFDAIATWYAVEIAGFARENNPSMAKLIEMGPWLFFGVKVGMVTFLIWSILYAYRLGARTWLVEMMLWLGVLVYGCVALLHIYGFIFWRQW